MTIWYTLFSIEHKLTAPYTSAQNGHAECLHQTILRKAQAMHLSSIVPAIMWDEFCVTSAYLTNFTTSSSLNGSIPYELWFSHKPSVKATALMCNLHI